MSRKNMDSKGRWRSLTVAFHLSPEENARIDELVALSGMTKQDYITTRLEKEDMTLIAGSRAYAAIAKYMSDILAELERIDAGTAVNADILSRIDTISRIAESMEIRKAGK